MTNPYGPPPGPSPQPPGPQQGGYGTPPPGMPPQPQGMPSQPPGHGAPMPGQPGGYAQPAPSTNGMAIASMVVSLLSVAMGPIIAAVGLVLGHIALRQIKKQPHRYEGRGAALTGVITGWIVFGGWALLFGTLLVLTLTGVL